MPWSAKDADKHKKGLSAKGRRQWAAVANAALAKCQKEGKSNCDASAIRQANAAVQTEALVSRLQARLDLLEKGRVLSSENEKALRTAVSELQAILAKLVGGEEVDEAAMLANLGEAGQIIAIASHVELGESVSYREREQQVRAALVDLIGNKDKWVWVVDLYDDKVIYERHAPDMEDGYAYEQRSYAIVDGEITFGDATAVKREVVYVPAESGGVPPFVPGTRDFEAGESGQVLTGDVIKIAEKAVRKDGTTPIKIISSGWGSSGYYDESMLKRDGPVAFPAGTHMYWDHPTESEDAERPERSLSDLAGVLVSDPTWDQNGVSGPGLYANAKVFGDYANKVDEIAEHIGVSIRAMGVAEDGTAEGRTGPIIKQLSQGLSVDFVTVAGAGGAVLQVFESARGSGPKQIKEGTKPAPTPGKESTNVGVTDEEFQQLKESMARHETELTAVKLENQRLKEARVLDESRAIASRIVQASRLPGIAHARVIESVSGNPPIKDGLIDREAYEEQVNEAIKAEIAYLGEAAGQGEMRHFGRTTADDDDAGAEFDEAKSRESLGGIFSDLGLDEKATKVAAEGRR